MTATAAVSGRSPGHSPALQHYRQLYDALPADLGAQSSRSAAFERFLAAGFPAAREEGWKYTSLRRLESRRFERSAREDAAHGAVDGLALAPHRVAFVNGWLREGLAEARQPGLALRTLGADFSPPREHLDAAAARGGAARFAALNAAFAGDGLLVDVDANACITHPLHVAFLNAGAKSLLCTPRLLVRLAPGARLSLAVEHAEDEAAERFVASVLEFELGVGARLELYRLQRLGDRSQLIETLAAAVDRDAELRLFDGNFGASLARLDVDVALQAPGAAAELHGVFLADGQRHLDTQVRVDHLAPHTRSEQVFRGVAAGRGRGVLLGKAVVHQDAQKAAARQSLKCLLLSAGAEVDVKPDLEIYADDVQCSHGATVGQLDAAALFYLRSRGLSEQAARSALTRAFAGEVLARMRGLPDFERAVHALVDRRLDALLEEPR
jgi:Fe-S cluster assembly protein SufD